MALRIGLINRLRLAIIDAALKLLTKPLHQYSLVVPNDLGNLKRNIRKGDVVLVEGNERLSECIKYLTQSSWSHSAIYVGDEPLRRDSLTRQKLQEQYGEEARFLLVEALVQEGVILAPLSKYRDFNIRVCRPCNLTREDLAVVLDDILSAVGYTYDVKNVLDLARYFLPVSLVPRRFRRKALQLGSGEPTQVICSSLIANAFSKVRFPIVPIHEEMPSENGGKRGISGFFWRGGPQNYGIVRNLPTTLITPRDFDLSPYFEVIKFNIIEDLKFDYRKLKWVEEKAQGGGLEKRTMPR